MDECKYIVNLDTNVRVKVSVLLLNNCKKNGISILKSILTAI